MSDVMSSVGPTALEAQPGANFVVEALRAYWHASPPFLSVRHAYIRFLGYMIHTWSSLATCVRSRSRKGAGGGGTAKPVSFLVTRQLFTHT